MGALPIPINQHRHLPSQRTEEDPALGQGDHPRYLPAARKICVLERTRTRTKTNPSQFSRWLTLNQCVQTWVLQAAPTFGPGHLQLQSQIVTTRIVVMTSWIG